MAAAGAGLTSLGIRASKGVQFATENELQSIPVDEASIYKIWSLTSNFGVGYSGMGPDSSVLIEKSRKQKQTYERLYQEPILLSQLLRRQLQ